MDVGAGTGLSDHNADLVAGGVRGDDAVPAVNEMLSGYDFKVQKGQLTEKAGMLDSYIDCYISDLFSEEDYEREEYLELGNMMIRGFIFDSDKLIEEIKRVVEE